ncbi:checkpoint protein HUS1 isoform X2 [Siniperca chuatsi]|uniref:checkpoint protein HUS1 isoform X2 n=1 Tax=Siniperca chuatsi TaxID=119488 RepID=UPI001CE1EDA9|nr:checkpoint protein HUS1 isoform X2 [Siniperca chuatsi]
MKFRGKIVDVACLNHFSRVITTISKLTKMCVLRLTPDHLFFVLSGKVANGGVSMWCELSQANFFDEYQMEGVSSEDNEICLEVTPENLSRALKTVQNAKAVKVKLTKKHCPCLTIAAELPTLSSVSRVVTHDVPVDVIPRRLWHEFKEPSMPDFDVSIYLPPLKTIKNVVDRMKNLSNFLVMEANLNGEMNLKIETDLVSVTTHFKDLGNPPWGKNYVTVTCCEPCRQRVCGSVSVCRPSTAVQTEICQQVLMPYVMMTLPVLEISSLNVLEKLSPADGGAHNGSGFSSGSGSSSRPLLGEMFHTFLVFLLSPFVLHSSPSVPLCFLSLQVKTPPRMAARLRAGTQRPWPRPGWTSGSCSSSSWDSRSTPARPCAISSTRGSST